MEYDDAQSYQDQLDQRFYKGKEPSECVPCTIKDTCEAAARIVKRILAPDYFAAFVFHLIRSIKITCLICRISKKTFYNYIESLQKTLPNRRKSA